MLIVTTTEGESGQPAVSQMGVRTCDAEGVLDLEALGFEGVRRTELSAV